MNFGKILAIAMIVLCALAAIGYACAEDWRHTIYWCASAILVASVTF